LDGLDENATVIVDLDHTLLLSNSTSEYLRSVRPRSLAIFVLAALKYLRPWRFAWWIPSDQRDTLSDPLRVVVCTVLFPWSPWLWRRRGRRIGAEDANDELLDGLQRAGRDRIVVATFGSRFVVQPILSAMPVELSHLIAGTFWRGDRIRRSGKAPGVEAALGGERVSGAYFITDSTDDTDLLAKVAVPILHQWSGAIHRSDADGVYIPFRYADRVKRPGAKQFKRIFLLEDLSLLILAIGLTHPADVGRYFALAFGLLSLFCIYEIGYHENDALGIRREVSPKVSAAFDAEEDYHLRPGAYVWALVTGGLAVWLAVGNDPPALVVAGILWLGLLAGVRLLFAFYNRVYRLRILVYPILQSSKTFGFLLLGPASPAGLVLMITQVARRSVAYGGYRMRDGRAEWRDLLILRVFLYFALATTVEFVTQGVELFEDWRFWLIAVWLVGRARQSQISQLIHRRPRSTGTPSHSR
jgi:hypothetical protein